MMSTISKSCVLGLLAAMALVACAADQQPADELPLTDAVDVSKTPPAKLMEVPAELTLDSGKADDVSTLACRVTLVYCRDPRYTPTHPSYCHNADCGETQAFNNARALCQDNCGSGCSTMYDLGGC